jgi:Ca2+-transporting ATPase
MVEQGSSPGSNEGTTGIETGEAQRDGRADGAEPAPFAREASEVLVTLGSDPNLGLSKEEAARRLAQFGANRVTSEKPPSVWEVALGQLRDPMNIMLIAVTVASLVIGEVSTAIIVALLILLNVVLGSRQELKARASVDALSNLQVPQAKVVRDGSVVLVAAVDVVPGDVVQVEAGDIVPADGRIVRSATLETQEAALTGESAPVVKYAAVLRETDVALGDRTNMLFQNTAVTRETAAMVVTATGMQTQMGQIATMLTSVTRTRSPLQKELAALTKVLGVVAWSGVALIVVVGIGPGFGRQPGAVVGHGDGHLRHTHGSASVCVGAAVVGRQTVGSLQGHREEPDGCRDAGVDQRHQYRQDRHPHHERDDGLGYFRERRLLHRGG